MAKAKKRVVESPDPEEYEVPAKRPCADPDAAVNSAPATPATQETVSTPTTQESATAGTTNEATPSPTTPSEVLLNQALNESRLESLVRNISGKKRFWANIDAAMQEKLQLDNSRPSPTVGSFFIKDKETGKAAVFVGIGHPYGLWLADKNFNAAAESAQWTMLVGPAHIDDKFDVGLRNMEELCTRGTDRNCFLFNKPDLRLSCRYQQFPQAGSFPNVYDLRTTGDLNNKGNTVSARLVSTSAVVAFAFSVKVWNAPVGAKALSDRVPPGHVALRFELIEVYILGEEEEVKKRGLIESPKSVGHWD